MPRLARATPDRLRVAAQALRQGMAEDEIARLTGYDPWFLGEIAEIVRAEERVRDTACRATLRACAG